jgi:hypothetical protein
MYEASGNDAMRNEITELLFLGSVLVLLYLTVLLLLLLLLLLLVLFLFLHCMYVLLLLQDLYTLESSRRLS